MPPSTTTETTMSSNNSTTPPPPTRRFPDGWIGPADSKFCKVCYDARRPVAEYTDHFVKDQPGPNGTVVCPTLLKQACRICGNTGHTSSYCSQYRRREEPRREEPRREERYIEREREPRREERYIEREREPRREERYIEREREPRRDSFNQLREDTERRDREIRERDDAYYREQDEHRRRNSTPWLQAVKQQPRQHRAPYAHPHGPRVRLNLEAPALSVATHGTADTGNEFIIIRGHQHPFVIPGAIDVLATNIPHSEQWGDEDADAQFNPDEMCEEFLRNM